MLHVFHGIPQNANPRDSTIENAVIHTDTNDDESNV